MQHWDWILKVDAYIYIRHWMRRNAFLCFETRFGSLGGIWWLFVGHCLLLEICGFERWLFICTSLLVRVLALERGHQVCSLSMGSVPFGRCCDSIMQTIFNEAWCRLLSFRMWLGSSDKLAGCSWGIAFYSNYVGSSVVVDFYILSCWCGFRYV